MQFGWKRLVEAILTTAGAALLAYFVFELIDLPGWLVIAAAVSAAVNGLFGGLRQVYAWKTLAGWYAFVVDSTWGIIGTTLGNGINIANLFWKGAGYKPDLSYRRNRHVFNNGFRLGARYANTQGCAISNVRVEHTKGDKAGQDSPRRVEFLDKHEDLHVWQNRWFGPLYQIVYLGWFVVGGLIVGTVGYFLKKEDPPKKIKEYWSNCGYYCCPWEYWAYKNDDHWDPPLQSLHWG